MPFKKGWLLILVLLLGCFFRLTGLSKNPAGFFCDEASIGYEAYNLWQTGKDSFGNTFPLFFRSFDDYKNPVYIYSAAPIVGLFGLSEYSLRLVSVIYGLLTILVIFFYVRELFGFPTAILSALFLSVSPWHILFSRVGFELIASVFWVVLSLYLLEKSIKNLVFYPLAAVSLMIAFLSYTTPKLYLPVLVLLFFLTHFSSLSPIIKKPLFWLTNFTSLLVMFLLLRSSLVDGSFFSRWHQVTKEPLAYSEIFNSYLNHFSLEFLFQKGDIDFPGQFITRHSVRGLGQLYWFQLPLLVSFLFKTITSYKKNKSLLFIVFFLLIYPLGTIFTQVNPQATRSVIGVVPFQIACAVGLVYLLDYAQKFKIKNIILFIFFTIMFLSVLNFSRLLEKYPQYSSDFWGWQYGAKPVMNYFLQNKDSYQQLCLEGAFNSPDIFLKFYDPDNYCQDKCQICGTNDYDSRKSQLFAITPDTLRDYPEYLPGRKFVSHKIINYPNGSPAFIIGEFY